MRGRVLLATALACLPGTAHAQDTSTEIPEGPTDAPRFIAKPAAAQRVEVPPPSPQHPFMTRNPWSNIHNDAYMSDTYETPGPLGAGMTRRSTFRRASARR